MRKLLNTIYITNEQTYLTLDGENLVCKIDSSEKLRVPFDNIENIVCFNYLGCSPALMGKCVSKSIPINFLTPYGKFLAKVCGETKGNVFLRVAQIDIFKEKGLELSQNSIAAKILNCKSVITRSLHDNQALRTDDDIKHVVEILKNGVQKIYTAKTQEEILGVEGNCARAYFSIFNKLITNKKADLSFELRSKRPPLDPVNALLSFVYTIYTLEYAAALETAGLDSYIGYFHSLRSGRNSLACDMVEETRCIVERFVLTLINLKIIGKEDFDFQVSGVVLLNENGRKKVLTKWQEKKRSDIVHPYLKQKIQLGLLPYVQSNLLAKYVRGEINEYPVYIQK